MGTTKEASCLEVQATKGYIFVITSPKGHLRMGVLQSTFVWISILSLTEGCRNVPNTQRQSHRSSLVMLQSRQGEDRPLPDAGLSATNAGIAADTPTNMYRHHAMGFNTHLRVGHMLNA